MGFSNSARRQIASPISRQSIKYKKIDGAHLKEPGKLKREFGRYERDATTRGDIHQVDQRCSEWRHDNIGVSERFGLLRKCQVLRKYDLVSFTLQAALKLRLVSYPPHFCSRTRDINLAWCGSPQVGCDGREEVYSVRRRDVVEVARRRKQNIACRDSRARRDD